MAPASRKASSSPAASPNSPPSTSDVCSPNSGARRSGTSEADKRGAKAEQWHLAVEWVVEGVDEAAFGEVRVGVQLGRVETGRTGDAGGAEGAHHLMFRVPAGPLGDLLVQRGFVGGARREIGEALIHQQVRALDGHA